MLSRVLHFGYSNLEYAFLEIAIKSRDNRTFEISMNLASFFNKLDNKILMKETTKYKNKF